MRCRPASLQKGCRAFTTPAPCVQRLPAPAASVTTATSPLRSEVIPSSRRCSSGAGIPLAPLADHGRASITSSGRTSSITALVGSRFCARPMRPSLRSDRFCSCCARSNPYCFRRPSKDCSVVTSALRGSITSKRFCTTPRNSDCARQAAPNLSNSARRMDESERGSFLNKSGSSSV